MVELELRQIRCFLTVASELHFGRAAEKLFLSQPTVSESIRSLETEIGGLLFERTSRKVTLTSLGREFLNNVGPAHQSILDAVAEVQRSARKEAYSLRVGFLGGGLYELTLPLLALLRELYPEIDLKLIELSFIDQFSALRDGTVDAAIYRLPVPDMEFSTGTVLLTDPRRLIVPAHHRLADEENVDPEELRHEKMPVVPADSDMTDWLDFHFPRQTPLGEKILVGPSVNTVRESVASVESGEAVMLMGERSELYYGNPAVRFVSIKLPPQETCLAWRKDDRRELILKLEDCAAKVSSRIYR